MINRNAKPRILLADDHRIVVDGLRQLLEPDFYVLGSVEDGRTLVKQARKLMPDVIIADISMPLLNGIEAARQIKEILPGTKIIFLTMHPDVIYAARAFEAGANGYVLKHSASDELVAAITSVLKGQTYVTPMIAGELMDSYRHPSHKLSDQDYEFTPRQREVLQLVVEGKSAGEIADLLCISPRTVEYHKYKMMEKLNLKSSTDLIRYAIKHSLL
jgi:DNA-binding NarL/FixJ family response regulator